MAEVKNEEEEHALPAKRKPDIVVEGKDVDGNESTTKKQKSEKEENNSYVAEEKKVIDENEEDEEDYEGDDDDEEEESDDDETEEHSNGEVHINRKGKGIMKDDKGKGKLIEESDDSSDSIECNDGESDDGDSDFLMIPWPRSIWITFFRPGLDAVWLALVFLLLPLRIIMMLNSRRGDWTFTQLAGHVVGFSVIYLLCLYVSCTHSRSRQL